MSNTYILKSLPRAAFGIEGYCGLDGEFHGTKTRPHAGETRSASSKCATSVSVRRSGVVIVAVVKRPPAAAEAMSGATVAKSETHRGEGRGRTHRSELERGIQLEVKKGRGQRNTPVVS